MGITSAVFTYNFVKLLVKPFTDVKLASNPYRQFATAVAHIRNPKFHIPNPQKQSG